MNKFQAQAYISKIVTMADKSLRLFVDTQEMKPEDEAMIFSLRHQQGWFIFCEAELKPEDVTDLPDIIVQKDEKHPSTRLRAVIYVLWTQTDRKQDFEVFYRAKMDKLINFIKEKLS